MKVRKFKALVNDFGLDDFGASGITFGVQSLKKGKIYKEYLKPVPAGDGRGGWKEVPSGYVIDDNGCWNQIGSNSFKKNFKEIKKHKNG